MSDTRAYKLDIAGLSAPDEPKAATAHPFLRVQFACCNVYQIIYRSPDGTCYHGRCPRCGNPVKFVVGEGGTRSRDFIVY